MDARAHFPRQRAGVTATLTQTATLAVLDRLDTGVLVVDRSGCVADANALAEDILAVSLDIGMLNGRLFTKPAALHDRLLFLVRASVDIAAGQPAAPSAALAIPRDGRLPLTLAALTGLAPGAQAVNAQAVDLPVPEAICSANNHGPGMTSAAGCGVAPLDSRADQRAAFAGVDTGVAFSVADLVGKLLVTNSIPNPARIVLTVEMI